MRACPHHSSPQARPRATGEELGRLSSCSWRPTDAHLPSRSASPPRSSKSHQICGHAGPRPPGTAGGVAERMCPWGSGGLPQIGSHWVCPSGLMSCPLTMSTGFEPQTEEPVQPALQHGQRGQTCAAAPPPHELGRECTRRGCLLYEPARGAASARPRHALLCAAFSRAIERIRAFPLICHAI